MLAGVVRADVLVAAEVSDSGARLFIGGTSVRDNGGAEVGGLGGGGGTGDGAIPCNLRLCRVAAMMGSMAR